jgi:hypothetical protein
MDYTSAIELAVGGAWVLWTEVRLRAAQQKATQAEYELKKANNKLTVKSESDSDAVAELNNNIRSNT